MNKDKMDLPDANLDAIGSVVTLEIKLFVPHRIQVYMSVSTKKRGCCVQATVY